MQQTVGADKEQGMNQDRDQEWKEEQGRYTSDSPDCEGCVFNFGNLNCAVYDIKPASIVIDHKPCEKRQPGGAI